MKKRTIRIETEIPNKYSMIPHKPMPPINADVIEVEVDGKEVFKKRRAEPVKGSNSSESLMLLEMAIKKKEAYLSKGKKELSEMKARAKKMRKLMDQLDELT